MLLRHVLIALVASLALVSSVQAADDKVAPGEQSYRYRVLGLFQPDRVEDLREAMKQLPEITLVSVDYATTEAEFRFDAAQLFPGVKQSQVLEQFNNRMRTVTSGTFSVRPRLETPRDKLERIEIPIVGLDCKGCSFGAYDSICRLEGVEQATASFKDGKVSALIDPAKTNRAALEAALKQRRVTLAETK
jgi:hypothetical protein